MDSTESLLKRCQEGDREASAAMFARLYEQLHTIAQNYMNRQPTNHTLQTTAVVNEAFVRMIGSKGKSLEEASEKSHFIRLAAKAMRSVLVDHARMKNADKRGGKKLRLTLSDLHQENDEIEAPDLLDLDQALKKLEQSDEQLSQLVELRFFGGLTSEQAAGTLEVPLRSAERSWQVARAWLMRELNS